MHSFGQLICVFSHHAAPPTIVEDFTPPSVICKLETLCSLSCYATSNYPVTYSWTKNGEVLHRDGFKVMNNSMAVTPRNDQDYGTFECNATNGFGSTAYKITLTKAAESTTASNSEQGNESE